MRSALSDTLRAEQRATEAALSVEERVARALALGDLAVSLYRAAHPGATRADARRAFEQARRRGRKASAVLDGLTGVER